MGSGEWGVEDEEDEGDKGNNPCPMPMPNVQCPMPNAQCPMRLRLQLSQ
ncbi:hypothetical protein [Nostoc sp.]